MNMMQNMKKKKNGMAGDKQNRMNQNDEQDSSENDDFGDNRSPKDMMKKMMAKRMGQEGESRPMMKMIAQRMFYRLFGIEMDSTAAKGALAAAIGLAIGIPYMIFNKFRK
jgi:hypothetical protein